MTLPLDVDTNEIARIARTRGVLRMQLFGSAVSGSFDPAHSDVDLLVEFLPGEIDAFDAYFGLKEDLERVFGRKVDLVMTSAVRNPHFRARALSTARELYAA